MSSRATISLLRPLRKPTQRCDHGRSRAADIEELGGFADRGERQAEAAGGAKEGNAKYGGTKDDGSSYGCNCRNPSETVKPVYRNLYQCFKGQHSKLFVRDALMMVKTPLRLSFYGKMNNYLLDM
jgi:hypothetical protein